MSSFEPIPVLARVTKHNDVEVCELRRTEDGEIGIPIRGVYFRLGGVMHRKARKHFGDGRYRSVDEWTWSSEGYHGVESTKQQAVDAMLADAGYTQVEIEATIQPLF